MSAEKQKATARPTKWQITYEDEDCTQIWKYDYRITTYGPIEVETQWKPHMLKMWKDTKSTSKKTTKSKKATTKKATATKTKKVRGVGGKQVGKR